MYAGIRRRRRRTARRLPAPQLLRPSNGAARQAESEAIRSAGDSPQRIDHALRQLRCVLEPWEPAALPKVLAVVVGPGGDIEVVIESPTLAPPPPWEAIAPLRWRLGAEAELVVPRLELDGPSPCPGLVGIGECDDRTVLGNLEAVGALRLVGAQDRAAELVHRWAWELVLSAHCAGSVVKLRGLGTALGPELGAVQVIEDREELITQATKAAAWGRDIAAEGVELVTGRMGGRIGDALVVVADPSQALGLAPGPGVVLIDAEVDGLVIDLDAGKVAWPGIGEVDLVGASAAALAVLGDAAAAAVDEIGVPGQAEDLYRDLDGAAEHGKAHEEAPAAVRIEILGSVRVSGVAWPPPRPQLVDLVAALALHPNGIDRERLFGLVWHDGLSRSSEGNRLSELRQWLGGPESVIAKGDLLALGPGVGVDWWDFERWAASPETRPAALGLVRGEPLEGILPNWIERDFKSMAIGATILRVALAMVDSCLEAGLVDQAWSAAMAAASVSPLDGRCTRAQLRVRHAEGDPNGMTAVISAARQGLGIDEDLEPETTALYQSLKRPALSAR